MRTPFVYVITHPALRSIKVGHSSEGSERLESFGRAGWQRYRKLFVATPDLAYRVEQATLFQIRHRHHAPQHLPVGSISVGGWTETVSASLITASTAWNEVCCQAGLIQLVSDQPQRRVSNRDRINTGRPLKAADLEAVRNLSKALGDASKLSTRNIREAVGCRTEYAMRLRDAVRAEGSTD